MWSLWGALLSCLLAGSMAKMWTGGNSLPTFIVTSPRKARYNSKLTVSVSASSVAQQELVHLRMSGRSNRDVILHETSLQFESDGVQTWTVEIDSDNIHLQNESSLQLRASYRSTEETLDIDMDPMSGYLLIQTDKVIYTPRQSVKYRVIALDDEQRFSKWSVTVDIKNQDLIVLERQHHTSENAFIGREFALPQDAIPGTWTITAYYSGQVHTSRSVTFDVQEYVLPTFKAELIVQEKLIDYFTENINIKTKAVYSYGEHVQGLVELKLGIVTLENVVLFPQSYMGVLDEKGECDMNISIAHLHDENLPVRRQLYVTVNVTEYGTGENASAVDLGTYYDDPLYNIDFSETKRHFKPGFPYRFVVTVRKQNGEHASHLPIWIKVTMLNAQNEGIQEFEDMYALNEKGRLMERFEVPSEAEVVKVEVTTLDSRVQSYAQEEVTINKFASSNSLYLLLDMEGHNLTIRFTPPETLWMSEEIRDFITVLIYSRGQMVYSDSVPRTADGIQILRIPPEVLRNATPSARVFAYFLAQNLNRDLVADSLQIDTEDVCKEELTLEDPRRVHFGFGVAPEPVPRVPKEESDIYVRGGPNMRVGLLAVDKAVLFLREEHSLTREKLFAALAEHDQGHGIGDGSDADTMFEYTGLQYVTLMETLMEEPDAMTMEESDWFHRINYYEVPQPANAVWIPGPRIFSNKESRETSGALTVPLSQIRRHFPESWLFEEIQLSSDGLAVKTFNLPDSITTWSFTAIGVGQEGGACVSSPLNMRVFKPTFTQVRLPYRAVRLEEVVIHVGIYNYLRFPINVRVIIRGDESLCFRDATTRDQHVFTYQDRVEKQSSRYKAVHLVLLKAGTQRFTVQVQTLDGRIRDVVEKELFVDMEGQRMQKAITFALDTSSRYTDNHTVEDTDQFMSLASSPTVTNQIFENQLQLTYVNMFMPEEIIHGSERCQISACGDLMGDVISHAVLKGENLLDNSMPNAEEAIGNLAPVVHGLLYLSTTGFLPEHVQRKGQSYVTQGVTRLTTYLTPDGSFHLTKDSNSATWLTALVLKTLCHAEKITFVDRPHLIDNGFQWLLDQINENGTLEEKDRRLAKASHEYDIMLSAEVLISLHECNRTASDDQLTLLAHMENVLIEYHHDIESPLVLAKAAYALSLLSPFDEFTVNVTSRLQEMRRTTRDGLTYWAEMDENEPANQPFWYHSGSRASSIEATAYALLVFTQQAKERALVQAEEGPESSVLSWDVNIDSIVAWLIQKRNRHGAFIGAMDTAVATQALSQYSLEKQVLRNVDLHCNVTTSPAENYMQSFDFTLENAIMPKSLSDVPVGRQLRVETRGTGLGQMQIRVEYNIPVDANAACRYDVTLEHRLMSFSPIVDSESEMCRYCNMSCKPRNMEMEEPEVPDASQNSSDARTLFRSRRALTATRRSTCLQVCVRSLGENYSDRTMLRINMLSGFEPYSRDLTQIKSEREKLRLSQIDDSTKTSVLMSFEQVAHDVPTCVAFRALEVIEVNRRSPALITVRAHDEQEPSCVKKYDPIIVTSTPLYCTSNSSNNQGQCRCFSGMCSQCQVQSRSVPVSLAEIQDFLCTSQYAYKIRPISDRTVTKEWTEVVAEVLDVEKGNAQTGNRLHLVAHANCACPFYTDFIQGNPYYFFGSRMDIFVDRNNEQRVSYLLDETTAFIPHSQRNQNLLGIAKSNCP